MTGFGNWEKATERFKEHQKSGTHISAVLKLKGYEQSRKTGSVASQTSCEHAKKVDEDRQYLKKICETLLFFCQAGIALRGHNEAHCYDGAANMRGAYSGVASQILCENPLAVYIHCHSHVLNLCIVDVCHSITAVRHMLANASSLYNFIEGSAKRHTVFESMQGQGDGIFGKAATLKALCDTR
ncbi:zinc finger MYM-type protein 1-like [Megalops cyprinoides]|uniref:zinc finger MYM-type protein 1-like n=1 Tax=Megalops cyprinoides TaxID=118141 RepID=UPI001864A2B1|nr:zinc finger MYM-type protein 1-like [Megalops cyprinoides]